MRTECSQLLASGEKCQAPAVSGSSLCRHHNPRNRAENQMPFSLPEFSDQSSLLVGIFEVLHAVSERRIDRNEAGTLLFGIQLASKVMSDVERQVHEALASGEAEIFRDPFIAESSCDPSQEPRRDDDAALKSVEALLRNMQTASIEPIFGQAKQPAPARKSGSESQYSVPGAPR